MFRGLIAGRTARLGAWWVDPVPKGAESWQTALEHPGSGCAVPKRLAWGMDSLILSLNRHCLVPGLLGRVRFSSGPGP